MRTINIRIDEHLKSESEQILEELGLNMTNAITLFLKAVARTKSIPFAIKLPNEETLKAFKEVDDIQKGKKKAKKYSNVSELRKDLKL